MIYTKRKPKELGKDNLPQYQMAEERYFETYHADSVTLHDDHIPPRGFSYDHLVLPSSINIHKPNQVKDQQPLTFIEGQQQQSSTGSFCLQPTTTTPNVFITTSTLVKPSV